MANSRYNSQVANKRVAKADGGILKQIPADKKKSLGKLPTKVRNKMGFMENGGRVKKNMGGILNSKPKKLYTEKDRTPKNKISDLKEKTKVLENKK
jgi:hypothetical protein